MISKATVKFVRSLGMKKNRLRHRLFVAEGPKLMADLLGTVHPRIVIATPSWLDLCRAETQTWEDAEVYEVTEEELGKVSFLKHPQQVIAVFPFLRQGDDMEEAVSVPSLQLCLALDGVRDPGNLGTIIRIADWFGIEHVFCSEDTADLYNPKVVQATMGSMARVKVYHTDLCRFIAMQPQDLPVYGTMLEGQNIYTQSLSSHGIIVMGNEGSGISAAVRQLVNRRLLIPNYPAGKETAESLNVAIATAITCAEFRRTTT